MALVLVAVAGVIFVHVPPANVPTSAAPNAKADQWPIPWNWFFASAFWTAVFTGVLTFYNTRLWRETRRLAEGAETQAEDTRKSLAIAKQAADAAEMQAKAVIASSRAILHLERPILYSPMDPKRNVVIEPGQLENLMIFSLPIHNVGGTTAVIETISFAYKVTWELPGYPPPHMKPFGIVGQPIRADGRWNSYSYMGITDEDMKLIKAGNPLWYFGYIRFSNLDETWDVGFVGQWEETGHGIMAPRGIIPGGPPIYAYTQKVEFKEI